MKSSVFILGLVSSALLSEAAFAGGFTDTVPSPISWSGLYVGMEAGYGWGDVDWNLNNPFTSPTSSNDKLSTNNFVAGGFVGLQRQFGAWVIGGEVGVDAGFSGDHLTGVNLWQASTAGSLDASIGPVFSATGKLGYAQDRWLAYVKGGYAGANISLHSDDGVYPNYYSHTSDWHNGYKVGGGVEYAVLPSTSIGVEYDYINLGGNSDTVPLTYASGAKVGSSVTHNADFTSQTVMARVTFHLLRDEPVAAPLK